MRPQTRQWWRRRSSEKGAPQAVQARVVLSGIQRPCRAEAAVEGFIVVASETGQLPKL